MSYEYNYEVIDALTDSYGLVFEQEEGFPAECKGMRALDYMPDMDDFEYQQSRY